MDLSVLTGEFFIILLLVVLNGLLAMSEMAMVTSRKNKLQQLSEKGSSGAQVALGLMKEPSRFLASIQIGITLIGVFAGAFGGANIASQLNQMLLEIPLLAAYASAISLGSVVLLVTLMSLVLGELVPKRLALAHAETIASIVARPVKWLSILTLPAVHFLSLATEAILKIFQYRQPVEPPITDDDIRILMEQGTQSGVFEAEEETIIKRTLKLSDRSVEQIMTPMINLITLDINADLQENLAKIRDSSHSYFPIYRANIAHIIGIISIKKLFATVVDKQPMDLESLLQEPLFVAQSIPALKLLKLFKDSGRHFAVVIDEYGGLSGVVTVIDLFESIVGDLTAEVEEQAELIFQREDGS